VYLTITGTTGGLSRLSTVSPVGRFTRVSLLYYRAVSFLLTVHSLSGGLLNGLVYFGGYILAIVKTECIPEGLLEDYYIAVLIEIYIRNIK
jgi:hypothetical protein